MTASAPWSPAGLSDVVLLDGPVQSYRGNVHRELKVMEMRNRPMPPSTSWLHLERNRSRNVPLEELADLVGMSKYRMVCACTARFGAAPHALHLQFAA